MLWTHGPQSHNDFVGLFQVPGGHSGFPNIPADNICVFINSLPGSKAAGMIASIYTNCGVNKSRRGAGSSAMLYKVFVISRSVSWRHQYHLCWSELRPRSLGQSRVHLHMQSPPNDCCEPASYVTVVTIFVFQVVLTGAIFGRRSKHCALSLVPRCPCCQTLSALRTKLLHIQERAPVLFLCALVFSEMQVSRFGQCVFMRCSWNFVF